MSVFLFGVRTSPCRMPKRERMACAAAAKELEINWIEFRDEMNQWKSWFAGPNLGHPFDADLRQECTRLVDSLLGGGSIKKEGE